MSRNSFVSPHLPTTRLAVATIGAYLIVCAGEEDGTCDLAGAADDPLLGVTGENGAAEGKEFDLYYEGIKPVVYGDDIVAGEPLTSDDEGRAIPATTQAQRIIGFAHEAGDEGTIGSVHLAPGYFTEPVAP